jgi:DNA repair photolyase
MSELRSEETVASAADPAGSARATSSDSSSGLRWRLADEERDGQAALFSLDAVTGPERGTGKLSGLEFLHVMAKRILNPVNAGSRMPSPWTINVYRGCSHACVYCLAGDTPILMADGRPKPLRDVEVGEHVYGTDRRGGCLRFTPTEVLAHWQTMKPAYRVGLADGTSLVASGDHRFLTRQGWKYVTGTTAGAGMSTDIPRRGHLTTADELLGSGHPGEPAGQYAGAAVASGVPLRVVSVTPLGVDLPMYDITTGAGDFVAGGVVSHNCFARPTHEYLGLNLGEDFDRKIVVKINAVERLRAELAEPGWTGEAIAMGTNTDPYQRCEGKYRLTRGVLRALADRGNPFSILTKSALVLRDLDILAEAAAKADVTVSLSVGTLDEQVWRATEPGTPHPRRRIEAIRRLSAAGIATGALIAPVLPGISDRRDQLREVVAAIAESGGSVIGSSPLFLRAGTREHYLRWLAAHDPDLHARYLKAYRGGSYLDPAYGRWLSATVGELAGEVGARQTTRPASPNTSGR